MVSRQRLEGESIMRNVLAVLAAARPAAARRRRLRHRPTRAAAQAHHRPRSRPATTRSSYNTFKLKGTITELQVDGVTFLPYAEQKVQLLKKACGRAASGRRSRRSRPTSAASTRPASTPRRGPLEVARRRSRHSNGYGTTKGKVWTLYFK